MPVFFTSDQHYGHRNIIPYCNRPFADIEEMTSKLIEYHNSVVSPGDVVYHLGDFSLNKRAPEEVLHRLNGEHHLIIGNHDWPHPVHSKKPEKMEKFRKIYFDAGFKSIELSGKLIINGETVLMSHFPYYDPNPEFDQRYPSYRPKDEGKTLLHGHVHTSFKTRTSVNGGLMVNVGVDQWEMKPVSLETISQFIKENK